MRRRVASALAALAALAVVVWLVRTTETQPEFAVPNVAPVVPSMSSAIAPNATIALVPPPAVAASAVRGSDEVELCGGMWVKTKPDGTIDEDDFKRVVHLPEARARMLDQLRADPGEFARAATIRLALIGNELTLQPDSTPPCETTAECDAQRRYSASFVEGRDALARMATTTTDPQVYALAYNVCQGGTTEGACQLLSARQWARLDPDNASPWLFVLAQAGQRRDVAAQNEALYHVATASRSDLHFFALPRQVLAHTPSDDGSISATLTLVIEAVGVEAAWSFPGYQALNQMCKGAALRDSNRRQTCDAAAEVLVARSDTSLERLIGVGIGAQLGWPAERLERLRGEYAAYIASLVTPASITGCASVVREFDSMKRIARLGEAGALREWVAQSGKKPEEFISAEREGRAKLDAEAASAAAASAASAPR